MAQTAELIIIRHGPTNQPGRLNGRTDVGLAERPARVALTADDIWVSPARRAVDTARGLFGDRDLQSDPRLWEQDFGDWDGKPFSEVPDVGTLDKQGLSELKADGGESFQDMVARVTPALQDAANRAMERDGPVIVVAHAGTVRVGLSMAMESVPQALAFDVGHLRATRFRCFNGGMSVLSVNEALS